MHLLLLVSLSLAAACVFQPHLHAERPDEPGVARVGKTTPVPRLVRRGPTDAATVNRVLRTLFVDKMDSLHVPGAVCVVVRDGRVLLAEGYGFADLERRTPADPDSTLFRVGSISKLVTATAVMQLAERGRINMNSDVNAYLHHFQLDRSFPQPVTIANLLTHTSGFDEWHIGMAARTASGVLPLDRYVAEHAPPRVHPPGTAFTYSNYAFSLAGHLVSSISGMPFDRYVEHHILEPLGMHASGFRLPPELARRAAIGYTYWNGRYEVEPPDHFHGWPSVDFSTTGMDAAKFMIAHLEDGRFGSGRILADSSVREMHRQHFTLDPRLPGVAYGFRERLGNGIRVLEHGGAVSGHTGLMVLAPEEKWGLFIACNTPRCAVLQDLVDRFVEHFYAGAEHAPNPLSVPDGFEHRARALVGVYRADINPRRNFEKVRDLFGEFLVTADSGRLLLRSASGASTSSWAEVEPWVFRRVDGTGQAVFHPASATGPARAFFNTRTLPYATFERVPWYERARLHLSAGGLVAALLLSACVGWPAGALLCRVRGVTGERRPGARLAQWNALAVSALLLLFLVGLLRALTGDIMQFMYGVPGSLSAVLWIPLASTALTVPLPIFAILAWRRQYWSLIGRVHFALVSAAATAAVPMLLYWNLLSAAL